MGATVIVGAFTIRPRRPVVEAVELMLERGDDVTLVVLRTTTWQDLAAHPRLTLLGLGELERRHPLRAVPALLLRRGPQAPLRRLIWLFGRSAATRRLCRPLVRLRRLVRDVGGAVDRRLYMPLYGVVRPLVLARLAVRAYGPRLPAAADAVVACDTLAVTFAARLARRYPQAVATTGTRLKLPAGAAA